MGYETRYTLKVTCREPDNLQTVLGEPEPDFVKLLLDTHPSEYVRYSPFQEPCCWYDHEEDMKEFSKLHPRYVFELHGEGDDAGDIWTKTFYRGRIHCAKAVITFTPPEPEFFFSDYMEEPPHE